MSGASYPTRMDASPIATLLEKLQQEPTAVPANDVGDAIAKIFSGDLTTDDSRRLLELLSSTGLEQRPDILARCAEVMQAAASPVSAASLADAIQKRNAAFADYAGGLCDIVGTGGDGHKTFNVSTASSILASPILLMAKHGNRASTSMSGSADVLNHMEPAYRPVLGAINPETITKLYAETNYGFLFAPMFHTGLASVASLRKALQYPTIFNLLGPLCNPVDEHLEARVIGVKRKDLVPVFAEALRMNGVSKALVVCGDEDLDEISCAGSTHCAKLSKASGTSKSVSGIQIERFTVAPEDFGLPRHELSTVLPGQNPSENAVIMGKLLSGNLPEDDPILHFVLMNAAALLAISGTCDADKDFYGNRTISEQGPARLRLKEGVRLAKLALQNGRALKMLEGFASFTKRNQN